LSIFRFREDFERPQFARGRFHALQAAKVRACQTAQECASAVVCSFDEKLAQTCDGGFCAERFDEAEPFWEV
jgi:hypothetical protein